MMLEYDKRVMWLEEKCRAAVPEVDWAGVPKLMMFLRGWWNEEYPMYRIMAWAYHADGREVGRACEISTEFMELDEAGALEMAVEMGRALVEVVKEE